MNKNKKNYAKQLVIINANWVFLAGTTQSKQKALFSLWSLKRNKFQKYKIQKKATTKTKLKKMLLEPSFVMEWDSNNNINNDNNNNKKSNNNNNNNNNNKNNSNNNVSKQHLKEIK